MSASGCPVETAVEVDTRSSGTSISSDLFGMFFENFNYTEDGGLCTEPVQNRSFQYSPADHPDRHALTAWELLERDGSTGSLMVAADNPLHSANPHHAVLTGTAWDIPPHAFTMLRTPAVNDR